MLFFLNSEITGEIKRVKSKIKERLRPLGIWLILNLKSCRSVDF